MSEYLGIYQGSVLNNNDPERRGRVICLIPQVLGDTGSEWCEPIYPTVYTPKVNETIWVHFVNGDLTRPIYFSADAVTAEKIVAGSITAESLDVDSIFATDINIIGSLTAGTPGVTRTTKINQDGVFLYGVEHPDSEPVVAMPTNPDDPVIFKGDATATNLTVTDSLSIESNQSVIRSGASLNLAGGVTAPVKKSTPSVAYETLSLTGLTLSSAVSWQEPLGTQTNNDTQTRGMTVSSDGLIIIERGPTGQDFLGAGQFQVVGGKVRFHKFAETGGAQTAQYLSSQGGEVDSGYVDLCKHGTKYFVLGNGGTQYYPEPAAVPVIDRFASVGVLAGAPEATTTSGVPASGFGITSDGTYLYVAGKSGSTLVVVRFNVSGTGALSSPTTYTVSGWPSGASVGYGLEVGTFGFGGTRFILSDTTNGRFRSFQLSGSALTEVTTESWNASTSGHKPYGFCRDALGSDIGFRSIDVSIVQGVTTRTVYKYTDNLTANSADETWWSSYSLADTYDVTPGDGLNPHETVEGPRVSFTMKNRARLVLTSPEGVQKVGPDTPDSINLYLGKGTSEPTPSTMWRVATLSAGQTTATLYATVFTGSHPITAGDPLEFSGGLPGQITSLAERLDGAPRTLLSGSGPSNIDGLLPPGSITMWAGATAPSGWLLCDGTSYPVADYLDLAAALFVSGTTYRFGNGSSPGSTFNVPNLKDHFPMGASATKALGTSSGADTVALAPNNIPVHTHPAGTLSTNTTGSAHDHSIDVGNATPGTVNNTLQRGSVTTPVSSITAPVSGGAHTHDVTGSTGNQSPAGGSTPVNILNPYLALNYIIKV